MKHFIAGLLLAMAAHAQDTRTVTEPVVPPTCSALSAEAANETASDTVRIQQALDRCPAGQAVALRSQAARRAFYSGPLQLRAGVTLLVDEGVTLFASRNPREYDLQPGNCGVVNEAGHGCKALISAESVAGAAVMGAGTIDGRGGEKLSGQNVSWWDLAQEAKARNLNQSVPRLLQLNKADNFTLYRIHLKNSPNFHVSYVGGNGFTVWGVVIDSPRAARNTDGIDPANATNVTITNSFIRTGDDNVAIKADGRGPSSHFTISHNHFYSGHGMSIGSETDGGVSAIRVTDLTIDDADNGIRIKSNESRGGLVHDVVYEDVCIRNTRNPIVLETHYRPLGKARGKIPQYRDIRLRNVLIQGRGRITMDGFDNEHELGVEFDNVTFDQPGEKFCEERFVPLPQ